MCSRSHSYIVHKVWKFERKPGRFSSSSNIIVHVSTCSKMILGSSENFFSLKTGMHIWEKFQTGLQLLQMSQGTWNLLHKMAYSDKGSQVGVMILIWPLSYTSGLENHQDNVIHQMVQQLKWGQVSWRRMATLDTKKNISSAAFMWPMCHDWSNLLLRTNNVFLLSSPNCMSRYWVGKMVHFMLKQRSFGKLPILNHSDGY